MTHGRFSGWIVAAALTVLAFVAYAPALEFRYAQDSYPAVKANPVVERGNVKEILTSDYWKDTGSFARTLYRPVTVASFALERHLTGDADPRISHLINILLHALTAWLLYRVSRVYGAGEEVGIAASVLFVLHPLGLHTVANVVGRADVLVVLFSLAALLCFAVRERRAAAWGAGLLVWLALGSKEIGAAVLPLLILAALLYRFRDGEETRRWIDRVFVFAPSVLAVLVYLHLRTIAISEFPGWQRLAAEDNVLVGMSGLPRVATTLAMAGRYALLLIWPTGLSPDYSGGVIGREESLFAALPLLGIAVFGVIVLLMIRPWLRSASFAARRPAAFAAGLYLMPYLLVGNVLTLNAAGFAERMVYFSSTGFCLLIAIGLVRLTGRVTAGQRRRGRVVLLALVSLIALLECVQLRRLLPMWRNNRALFEYTIQVAPRSLRAALAVARRHEAGGRMEQALEIYERIATFAPRYGGAWMARGALLARTGDLDGAEHALRRSVELQPEVGDAHFQLGLVLIRRHRMDEAERALRRALIYNPRQIDAAAQLGHLLYAQHRYAEAVRFYAGCVRFGRDDLRGKLNDARLQAAGRLSDAGQPSQ